MQGNPANFSRIREEIPYKAFSGANIYATVYDKRIASLQALTCSVTREVAALYGFGDANPKAFVKGKRGIAGTLVFTQFDRHALLGDVFRDAFAKKLGDPSANHLFNSRFYPTNFEAPLAGEAVPTRNFANLTSESINAAFGAGNVNGDIQAQLTTVYDMVANQRMNYADQIPEFDLTVSMVNESGDAAFTVIGGVTLVNEGWGYSLDDLTSEVAYTYVARFITPLTSLTNERLWKPSQR